MYEKLLSYINQHITKPLSLEEIELVKAAYQPKKLRKHQYLLQEGEVCKYSAFVVKGAMRQYSVDDKGVEHIVQLAIENWWVGDRESFINLTPSSYNIDAWEDSELLLISRANVLSLADAVPVLAEMLRQMDERNAIATQRRLNATISFSADKRYEEFSNWYPALIQRFPQHQIASYLGFTKETLSRIRKRAIK